MSIPGLPRTHNYPHALYMHMWGKLEFKVQQTDNTTLSGFVEYPNNDTLLIAADINTQPACCGAL